MQVRLRAFGWLRDRMAEHGDVLPRTMLAEGFTFEGDRVPLLGPQGIFKPRLCELPLSITTSPNGPYRDAVGSDGLIEYRYRGTDPAHPDNTGLRRAMASQTPLTYFVGIDPGRYAAVLPAFIVGDDVGALTFKVQADDLDLTSVGGELRVAIAEDPGDARRRYITTTVQRRLHQAAFREHVLRAYTGACALCHLRHSELLDAAHIDEDSSEHGEPVISNGLALCKLHHAAFDSDLLTVTPNYRVEVRPSILRESDGPMLIVGLQQAHGQLIGLPRRPAERPDPVRLERRYERFVRAS
jgi:putative restriction endonuclease